MNEAFFFYSICKYDIYLCSKIVCCYLGGCEKETLVDRTRVPHLRKQIICQKIGCPWFIHAFIHKLLKIVSHTEKEFVSHPSLAETCFKMALGK